MNTFPVSPPIASRPRPWVFPETVTRTLANGLTIAVVRMPSLPIVSVRWAFRTGRLHETTDQLGSGMLLQRMLRHGTQTLSSAELARQLDRRGSRLGTQVSVDSMVVSINALREYLDEALEVGTAVALGPAFPEASLAMERIRALQVHQHERAQIETMASMWLARAMYGEHPYGRPAATHSGLTSIGREDLCALHGRIVDMSRALLVVSGDVDPFRVVDSVARRLEECGSSSHEELPQALSPAPSEPGIWMVERPNAEQTAIGVGLLTIPRNHPDFLPLRLVNRVFGGGASSRLFTALREKQGLTYGVYSTLDCGLWAGDLTASMLVAPNKTVRGVQALAAELERMGTGVLSPDELRHSADYLIGSFPQRASGLSGVSSLTMAGWLHKLKPDAWANYQTDIARIGLEQVREAAQTWLRPERAAWVIAGPPEALDAAEQQLQSLQKPIHRVGMDKLLA